MVQQGTALADWLREGRVRVSARALVVISIATSLVFSDTRLVQEEVSLVNVIVNASLLCQDHLILVDEPFVGTVRIANVNLTDVDFVWVFRVTLVAELPAKFVGACRVEAFIDLVLATVTFLGSRDLVSIVIDSELASKSLVDHEQRQEDAQQRNR